MGDTLGGVLLVNQPRIETRGYKMCRADGPFNSE